MIAAGLIFVWYANFVMQSNDMEAPFVLSAIAVFVCLPAALACLVVAARVASTASKLSGQNKDGASEEASVGLERFFRH